MAERYLPTELQDENGNVIYPHSQADIIWTQDGRSVEEVLKKKMELVVSNVAIPVEQRTPGAMYMFIEGENPASSAAVAMASPAVGYRML